MKTDLLIELTKLNPEIKSLDQQPIIDSNGETVGWNCYFMNQSQYAVAGGTSSNLETAKRIAVAEAFERALFQNTFKDPATVKLLRLDESPSTSGFAAGFDENATAFRSKCEAIERWAWSKWIDYHYFMPQIKYSRKLTKLTEHLLSHFDFILFFQKDLSIQERFSDSLSFSVLLGFKNHGVFAGSRVTGKQDEIWEHPAIEAYRNLKNFEISDRNIFDQNNMIAQRAIYFGSKADEALSQVEKANIMSWEVPEINLHQKVETHIPSVYLYRSMCKNFLHWHLGDKTRFVY
jgi:hypothetical protein